MKTQAGRRERSYEAPRKTGRKRKRGAFLRRWILVLLSVVLLAAGLRCCNRSRAIWATGTGEPLLQKPELPNGCEITSLTMLLQWAGVRADKTDLAENWLPREPFGGTEGQTTGPDPEKAYAGNPAREDGWYCFEGPILDAANGYLEVNRINWQAVSLTDISRRKLNRMVRDGVPMAVWVTLDYGEPTLSQDFSWYLPDGSLYQPYRNLHCVVLAGTVRDQYRIADPLSGWKNVSQDEFWEAFSALGSRALALQHVDRDR